MKRFPVALTVGVVAVACRGSETPVTTLDNVEERTVELPVEAETPDAEEPKTGLIREEEKTAQQQVAENSGTLGALGDDGSSVGGLIGQHGVQTGTSGLGGRGIGVGGGGGTAEGLGGLGTKGMGSGSSGYGGGSFANYGAIGRPSASYDAPGSREGYTHHGTNAFVLTSKDPLSTFSIDVDTGSWSMSRRKLNGGALPDQAGVRVEEFVNAMSYDDPSPGSESVFAIALEATPHPFVPSHHLVRVNLKTEAVAPVGREPVHLVFLVDVSGSMSGPDRLPLAKQSLHWLVKNLDDKDTVAIATYAGNSREVLQPTLVSRESDIAAAIDELQSGGGTAMGDGMKMAYRMAEDTMVAGEESRVIVLSDGDANIGHSTHDQILKTLETYAKKGITMSTIGFGTGNYQDTTMEQLADKGDGNYHYIDSFDQAKKVFGRDLAANLRTVARDTKIQVEFDSDAVDSYRLIGYENRDVADVDFRNDKVDAGEVGAGHSVTALYEVVLHDDAAGDLATVRIRWKPPGPDAPSKERAVTLPASSVKLEFAQGTRSLRQSVAAATFAELLRGSRYAEEVRFSTVEAIARNASRPGNTDDAELVELIHRASELTHDVPPVLADVR